MNRENLKIEIKDIWSHRYFILSTIKTEFRLCFIRTILLFVARCMGTILNLCSRVLLLRKGELIYDRQQLKDVINLHQFDLIVGVDKNDMHLTIQSASHNSVEIESLSATSQIVNITSDKSYFGWF